ncbi:MAG: DUF222 domain-containing protein, partial [Pseudohongiella sp.]
MNATTLNQHCPQTGIDIPVDIPSDIPSNNDELVVAITTLAGHINAAQHRFLKLLAALVERDAWGDGGSIKSPAHWLNYYCGIDLGAAREKVRVAKSLTELPQIDAAFASGAISYSKVRAMTRSATPHNESYLLNIARHGTAHHMEMLVRKYQRTQRLEQSQAKNTDGDAAAAQFAGRELHWHYDDDGMLVIRGRLTPEDGAMFIKALDGAFAQLQQPGEERDRQSDFEKAIERNLEKDIESDPKNVSAETFSAHQTPESEQDVPAETPADSHASEADTFPQKRADALMLLAEQSFL